MPKRYAILRLIKVQEIVKFTSDFISIAGKTVEPFAYPTKETKVMQGSADYLCFLVENQEYAFNIQDVIEVNVFEKYAILPFSPSFIKGVINFRGKIIPIIDSRVLFGLSLYEYSANSVVIVIQAKYKNNNIYVGILADAITEKKTIHYADISPVPENIDLKLKSHVQGLANISGNLITLLQADLLVTFPEQRWRVV